MLYLCIEIGVFKMFEILYPCIRTQPAPVLEDTVLSSSELSCTNVCWAVQLRTNGYNWIQMRTNAFKCIQIFEHWLHISNNLVQPTYPEVPHWSTTNRVSPVDIIVVTSKTGGFKKLCVLLCVLQKSTSKKYYKKVLQKVLHLQNRQDLSFLMVFSKNILFILRSVRFLVTFVCVSYREVAFDLIWLDVVLVQVAPWQSYLL